MQNQLLTMMMTQLQQRNPQMFQMINQLRQNNGNPMELLKQVTNKYTPEQMNNLFNKAQQFGIPADIINNLKNDINIK